MSRQKREIGDRWMKDGIRIRQGKRGRTYQAAVSTPKGMKWETYKTFAEAREARDRERVDAHDGRSVLNSDATVSTYMDAWLKLLQVRDSTREQYARHAEHIKAGLGDKRLQELTVHDIRPFIYGLETLPRPGKPARPASPSTKVYVLGTLKAACAQAVADSLLKRNPCDGVNRPAFDSRDRRPLADEETFSKETVLSPADVDELLSHLNGHGSWLPALTLWRTGLRRGELAALRWRDVDFDKRQIWVRGTVSDKREVGAPKTKRSASAVSIDGELVNLLRHHRNAQSDDAWKLIGKRHAAEWFVFASPESPTKPLRPGTLAMVIQYQLKGTRFEKVSPHDLRHAHGSALLHAGWSIARVAARLRDRQETLVRVYSHELRDDEGDGIADVFGLVKTPSPQPSPAADVTDTKPVRMRMVR